MTTERSPLLPSPATRPSTSLPPLERGQTFSQISTAQYWDAIRDKEVISLLQLHELLDAEPLPPTLRTSIMILLTLHLIWRVEGNRYIPVETVRQRMQRVSSQGVHLTSLNATIHEIWEGFLAEEADLAGQDDVCQMLTTLVCVPHPRYGVQKTRVIDHLHVYRFLLESDFITLGLEKIWEGNIAPDQSLLRRVYSRVTSPRGCYSLALLFHLAYFSILTQFVICPLERKCIHNVYAMYAILYAFASIVKRPISINSLLALISIVIFTALILNPASKPAMFSLVILIVAMHAVQLQIVTHPTPPSPLLLLSPKQTVLLSSLIMRKLWSAVIPTVLYFGPITILTIFLLSLSLQNIPYPILLYSENSLDASPYGSRLFVSFFLTTLLIAAILLFCLLFGGSYQAISCSATGSWGVYGADVGDEAKRKWSMAVAHWSSHQGRFPPPLNILALIYDGIVKLWRALKRGNQSVS